MLSEQTEKPSQRKLRKAKERGDVPKSTFLAGATIFLGSMCLIWGLSTLFSSRFRLSLQTAFSCLDVDAGLEVIGDAFRPLLLPTGLTLLGILCISWAAHFFQTGWIWAPEQIQVKWRKKKRTRRLFLPLIQLILIGGISYLFMHVKLDVKLLYGSPDVQSETLFRRILFFSCLTGVVLFLLGICDFFYQKWRYFKKMHMSPEEKKQEVRESEGSSQVKQEMRNRFK